MGEVIAGVGQHPRHRQLRQRHAGLGGQRPQRLDRLELALVPVAVLVASRRRRPSVNRVPSGRRRLARVLAGEQPARDRVVRDHPDALLRAQRQQLALDLAEEQVVARLHRVEAHEAAAPRCARCARATW